MDNLKKQIRTQLRLAMNGIVSASMREKGVNYKLNFGVSLPKLKEIARQYDQNRLLAESLWLEDVRELKILATMLYPLHLFTIGKAEEWITQIQHIEIAEQLIFNILQHLPFADQLAKKWISKENYCQFIAYHLYIQLFRKGLQLSPQESDIFIQEIRHTIERASIPFRRIAFSALIKYGTQTKEQAQNTLAAFNDYKLENDYKKNEFYENLADELLS